MMILFLLILTFAASGQSLLNENFSRFQLKNDSNVQLLLRASNTANEDLGKNGIDFTAGNFSTLFADELVSGSPSIALGSVLQFHKDSLTYFQTATNLDSIVPLTSNFTLDIVAKFEAATGPYGYLFSLGNTYANTGYEVFVYVGAGANDATFRVRNETTSASAISTTYNDGSWHIFTAMREGDSLKVYVDGVLSGSATGVNGWNISRETGLRIGSRVDGFYYATFKMSEMRYSSIARDKRERKESFYLADNWVSLNGGVTRAGLGFHQGIVNDTIYYNTSLTAGNWNVSISDSAASGVSYEVLTSADAATWATLASGTTGTSWGSKSYSGTGTGYLAIAVASGTAFFDDLVVRLAGGEKEKYNGYKGWLGY